jgi:hypothetical protein
VSRNLGVIAVDFEAEGTPMLNPDLCWEGQDDAVFAACSTLITVFNGDDDENDDADNHGDHDDTRVVPISP